MLFFNPALRAGLLALGALVMPAKGVELSGTVDAELLANLQPELPVFDEATTRFEALRQARRAQSIAMDWLNSQAYFQARITPQAGTTPPYTPRLELVPGPQFTVGEVRLPRLPLPVKLDLQTGDTAFPTVIQNAHQSVVSQLQDKGFALARTGRLEVLGDAETATVDLTLDVEAGPKVTLNQVIFPADNTLKASAQRPLIPFEPGVVYSPEYLSELEQRIARLQLFSVYAAELTEPDARGVANVKVRWVPRERYTVATGLSFASDRGVGLAADLTVRNFSGRGDTLSLSPEFQQDAQSLASTWTLPNAHDYGLQLSLGAAVESEDTDAFRRDGLILSAGLEDRADPALIKSAGIALERSKETEGNQTRNLVIPSVFAGLRWDRADDLFDPTQGWRASVRVEPGLIGGDTTGEYVATRASLRHYWALESRRRWILASQIKVGQVFAKDELELPSSRRFFGGGGGSARGYSFQSIGPTNDQNVPIGGRKRLELSGEIRWRATADLGVVAFVDSSAVGGADDALGANGRVGAGLGARYFTAIGPIRFDLGVPLDRRTSDDPFQIYLSIGHAF